MSDAQITVVGNLTRDPDLSFGPSGTAICKLGVAVNRRVKQGDEWVDGEPTFLNCTAFGSLAEGAAETLARGMRVVVVGRLEQRNWEKDGESKSGYEVVVDECGPSLRWATAVVSKVERS